MKNDYNELEKYLLLRLKDSTVNSYLYIIRRFLYRFPKPSKLRLTDLENYFNEFKQRGDSVRYRRLIIASVKAYYDFLIDLGAIQINPCKRVKTETAPTGTNFTDMLTMEEMESMFKAKYERFPVIINRDRAIIGILIYQGVSREELVTLRVKDVNFDAGTIFITGCRKNRNRTLSLRPSQVPVLLSYINEDRKRLGIAKSDKLFISMRGMPMTSDSVHALVNRMAGAFDKELSPSNIRRSVISYWLNERKVPLEDVQIMAGHRYPSSTEKYLQNNIKEQREAVTNLHQSIFGY